jgi:glucose-1-phosphate cytidylyltransferase
MKVVLFCGGFGVRMGDATERIPKPMISVGGEPILWHIMRYYAAWGHREFILCLGHRAEVIETYFDGHPVTNDSNGWKVECVDTGLDATIAERLKAVDPYLGSDREFLATYADGLTDASLDDAIAHFRAAGKTALFLAVRPHFHAHVVYLDESGVVRGIASLQNTETLINGGFFVFKREIMDVIQPGEELVDEPFRRLIERGELIGRRYDGFWAPMDTLKDKQYLDGLAASGHMPWTVVPDRRRGELGDAEAVA